MNVLSIDVGMKNLAYCILKVKDNTYDITDWDIINLCNDKKYICEVCTKKEWKIMEKSKIYKI